MDRSWDGTIRNTKQLQIFAGFGVSVANWSTLLDDAIKQFNKLSASQHFGVTYARSTNQPDPNGPGGAQVLFEVRPKGAVSYTVYGQTFTVNVGEGLAGGHTQIIALDFGGVTKNTKAFIAIPNVLTTTPPNGKSRDVGDGVKLARIVHEMIHACGLDKDGADESMPDVFFGSPQLDAGSTPADDKLRVGKLRMPPIVISTVTTQRIQTIW